MHPEAIRPETKKCLALLVEQSWLKDFYLAGGTGLALHLGHRLSEDLDFFSKNPVDPKRLRSLLAPLGNLRIEMEREGTLWAQLDGIKVSFIHYEYDLIDQSADFEGCSIAGIKDIACMKLDTISSRGYRRDFFDLYFILQENNHLSELFGWFEKKFQNVDYNHAHLLKSLTYFGDAAQDKDPEMITTANWEEVQAFFQKEVTRFAKI